MALSVPSHPGPILGRPRLLLVDDDPILLRALRRLLLGARPGWLIDTADSAETALRLLESNAYDVAVTDLQMPGLDGIALLRRLKTEHRSVMRVIHSSHAESLTSEQYGDLADAVVAKPARSDELVVALEQAIDRSRLGKRSRAGPYPQE